MIVANDKGIMLETGSASKAVRVQRVIVPATGAGKKRTYSSAQTIRRSYNATIVVPVSYLIGAENIKATLIGISASGLTTTATAYNAWVVRYYRNWYAQSGTPAAYPAVPHDSNSPKSRVVAGYNTAGQSFLTLTGEGNYQTSIVMQFNPVSVQRGTGRYGHMKAGPELTGISVRGPCEAIGIYPVNTANTSASVISMTWTEEDL